jgi:hypothetical protein
MPLSVDAENCTDRRARAHGRPLDASGVPLPGYGSKHSKDNVMAIERMLTEAEPAGELIGRVLHEAGIEYVFGISGGHTGRIISGLRKYQNSVRLVTVREEY